MITEDILRRYFGFNDSNVIRGILNDPAQVARYTREYQGITGGGTTTAPTLEQQTNSILDAQKAMWDKETQFIQKYIEQNPFAFDEELARKASGQEYKPYYTELLQDYLGDVESRRTTIQDERKYYGELRQLDIGQKTRAYSQAVAKAEQGYAGQGMFFSGIKKAALGQGEVEQKAGMERLETTYGQQQLGLTREEQDLARAEEQKRRDIFGGETALGGLAGYTGGGGLYQTAVEGGIRQRGQEQVQQYNIPFVQAYQREFPTGSNQIQGYTVPDYLQYRT